MIIDFTDSEYRFLLKIITRTVAYSEMNEDVYRQWSLPDSSSARELLEKLIKAKP